MRDAVVALTPTPGLTAGACVALSVPRASVYRQRARLARPSAVHRPRPSPRRALACAPEPRLRPAPLADAVVFSTAARERPAAAGPSE